MIKVEIECDSCGTECTIKYDPEDCVGAPTHCAFCGEPLSNTDDSSSEDNEEMWD